MIPTDPAFDLIQAEAAELDVLIEKGTDFTVTKQSPLRFFGSKERTFILRQPFLGTLDRLAYHYIRLTFDKNTFEGNPIEESKRVLHDNAQRCARIVAIAILNSYWKIPLFTELLARYFLWHLTPQELFLLTVRINTISNLGDFINSIRLMSVTPRMTTPALMEKTPEAMD